MNAAAMVRSIIPVALQRKRHRRSADDIDTPIGFLLFSIIFWIAWMTSCIVLLVWMQQARRDLEEALGQQYLDTVWGFGQITVLLMWLPTTVHVIGKIICEWSRAIFLYLLR